MQTQTPEQNAVAEPRKRQISIPTAPEPAVDANARQEGTTNSTLIEFPGTGRNRPAWRKELSERVREIQQRRAREAVNENEEAASLHMGSTQLAPNSAETEAGKIAEANTKQLGLVPPPLDSPEPNPIVVAALLRVERARRHSAPQMPRQSSSRANATATATARVAENQYDLSVEPAPQTVPATRLEALKSTAPEVAKELPAEVVENKTEAQTTETARASSLVVVPPQSASPGESCLPIPTAKEALPANVVAPAATPITTESVSPEQAIIDAPQKGEVTGSAAPKPQPRRIEGIIDDSWLTRLDAEILPKVVTTKDVYDDRASRTKRMASAASDLLFVAFLSAPFAAAIELTIGNWRDPRVIASMSGIVAVLMFLYLTCSTALAGRTLGMKLFSLHAVDATSALSPTTGQCARRAIAYMLSLATGGLGFLYALFDAEGRTAHDRLSGTVIVKG